MVSKKQTRENLKNDFDKETVVDLLCGRIEELEAENAELREEAERLEQEMREPGLGDVFASNALTLLQENAGLRERVGVLGEALEHIKLVMDTQVAESRQGPGRSYSMSPGGYSGVQASLKTALSSATKQGTRS